jgi:hypothetical protein
MTIPCELHLEILRRCDFASILSLHAVNRHFNNLVIDNQQFLARVMRDRECIGPHAILAKLTPSERSAVPDYRRIRTIQRSKSETAVVLRECKLAETDANTEAVHRIRYAIDRLIGYWVFGPGCLPNESAEVYTAFSGRNSRRPVVAHACRIASINLYHRIVLRTLASRDTTQPPTVHEV